MNTGVKIHWDYIEDLIITDNFNRYKTESRVALTRWHMPNWCGMWSQCGNSSSMSFTSKNMPAVQAGNTYQQSLLGGLERRKRSTLEAGATDKKRWERDHQNNVKNKLYAWDWTYSDSQVLTTGSLIASALYIVIPGSSLKRIKISEEDGWARYSWCRLAPV